MRDVLRMARVERRPRALLRWSPRTRRGGRRSQYAPVLGPETSRSGGPGLRPRENCAPGACCCVGVELLSALLLAALIWASPAEAHIERAGYWPDPAPDVSIHPAAGGAVPTPLSLASALREPPGETRVVCEPGRTPLRELRESIRRARLNGYRDRPTQDLRKLSPARARKLLEINRRLRERCAFRSIQAAVDASGNNDRVVIMPGVYTEPRSRASSTDDPRCDGLEETNDHGDARALSYAYQLECPNDQNLIAVMGRSLGPGSVPQPPLDDRHGIPAEGRCIRCNLQIEGSGASADDVVIDAGNVVPGTTAPPNRRRTSVIRADRADGFVLRGVTVRHAGEHEDLRSRVRRLPA